MCKEQRIKELYELRELLILDLRNIRILEKKIGKTKHQEEMIDKFLDQLNDINNELMNFNNILPSVTKKVGRVKL